jgi:hypothetical protein
MKEIGRKGRYHCAGEDPLFFIALQSESLRLSSAPPSLDALPSLSRTLSSISQCTGMTLTLT